jgi:hypothetical protein
MTLTTAATSTNMPEMSVVLFAGIALFVTVGYAVGCWIKPFTVCHRCAGSGTAAPTTLDRLRGRVTSPRALRGRPDCRHCRGSGLRLRIGRRLVNHIHRIHRQTSR